MVVILIMIGADSITIEVDEVGLIDYHRRIDRSRRR